MQINQPTANAIAFLAGRAKNMIIKQGTTLGAISESMDSIIEFELLDSTIDIEAGIYGLQDFSGLLTAAVGGTATMDSGSLVIQIENSSSNMWATYHSCAIELIDDYASDAIVLGQNYNTFLLDANVLKQLQKQAKIAKKPHVEFKFTSGSNSVQVRMLDISNKHSNTLLSEYDAGSTANFSTIIKLPLSCITHFDFGAPVPITMRVSDDGFAEFSGQNDSIKYRSMFVTLQ